ncbi:MAG: chemotaxis response regulator protein-glutamate methylesterase [Stenomitos rutilans HA7619-LM2]|jgi:two-component system response regulator WspF|nr:chemotaxis response regulator protein-glutamate methylesterase [Stenomitos rutilans HA7619-LM2]
MKIAIVNDLAIAVAALRRVVQTVPDYDIIWTAKDGLEAVTRCAQETPDLILMDLLMPVMDGVEATRQIMQKSPCSILVVTSSTEKHVSRVYEAMCHGALDAVNTPILNAADSTQSAKALLAKIATLRKLIRPVTPTSRPISSTLVPSKSTAFERSSPRFSTPPIIAIGSSTGGPKMLATVLSKLPVGCKAAIVVVQHVDVQFAAGLVSWLDQQISLPVRVAKAGEPLEAGTVLVAGTNDHLYIKPDLTLGYIRDPIDYPYRPSVDVLFKSLADRTTQRGTAVLLTGMGRDGAEGLLALRSCGWHTIAQDKASCVVYGMPKAAVELNAAIAVLPPEAIATALLQTLKPAR